MNRSVAIIVIISVLAVVAVAGVFLLKKTPVSTYVQPINDFFGMGTNTNVQGGTSTTTKNPQGPTMTVATDYENTIVVSDFRKATTTIEDTNNPGRYHLEGGTGLAQVEAPYLIVYTESDQSFNISL